MMQKHTLTNSNYNKSWRRKRHQLLPMLSILSLYSISVFAINPYVTSSANASDATLNLLANDTSLSLTINNGSAPTTATQAQAGTVAYIVNNVKVAASNVDGYEVFVQADGGSSNNLTGVQSKTIITGVGNNVSPNSFGENRWGYSFTKGANVAPGNMTYSTLPASSNTTAAAYSTSASNETQDFTLAFAAKFAQNTTADHYKTNVVLSVAAGAKDLTASVGFAGKTYMQDVNKSVCDSVAVGSEGKLIDKRDGKIYWVAKLKDGLCWMTQNLDLDLWDSKTNKGITLTSADSDISGSWTSTTGPSAIKIDSDNYYLFVDPGDYFLDGGTTKREFINQSNNATWTPTDDYKFVEQTSYLGTDGTTVCSKAAGSAVGNDSGVSAVCRIYYVIPEDTASWHQHIGNLYTPTALSVGAIAYNRYTATGDTSGTTVNTSICPKGWKLPSSNTDTTLGSFGKMLTSFGSYNTSTNAYGYQKALSAPLYFILSGYMANGDTAIREQGVTGQYASGTYYFYVQNTIGYDGYYTLSTTTGYTNPSNKFSMMFSALPVRCVAR